MRQTIRAVLETERLSNQGYKVESTLTGKTDARCLRFLGHPHYYFSH